MTPTRSASLPLARRRLSGAAVGLSLALALSGCGLTGREPDAPPLPEVALPAPQPAAAAMARGAFAGFVRGAVLAGPGTAASVARVAAADAEAEGAARANRPELTLSLDAAATSLAGGSSAGLVPALGLAQTLFDFGATRRLSEAAQARLRAAEAEQAAALTRLALDVVEAVAALELERRRAVLAEDDREGHAELLAGITARAEAGTGTEGEVLTARGRLAGAEAAAVAARGAVNAAEARLEELAGPGHAAPPPLPAAPALAPVPVGGAATPELAAREAALAAARADLAAAEARRMPVAALNLSARQDADGDEDLSGSLGLDYTADTQGRRRTAVAAAAARLAEAEAEREAAARAATRAARQAADALATARDRAAAARRATEAERAAFAAAEAEVERGRRPATALLDARRDLTQAERLLAEAEMALKLAGWRQLARDAALLSALGLPLPGAAPVAVAR